LGEPPEGVKLMTEDALVADMTALIQQAPRAWKDILPEPPARQANFDPRHH